MATSIDNAPTNHAPPAALLARHWRAGRAYFTLGAGTGVRASWLRRSMGLELRWSAESALRARTYLRP